ncbi:carbohydrate-binding protein [Marinobacter sp. 71-i]|uniref:Carbohydrate-binding protein n=1 Tax=Marinobacter iranensis TaxID=2962607 RepID=A0ABT5YDW5_9GAMM|nr:carbohydrate-binding protein [Marinobacter iranensis]MDF0751797.1 carbohydrate-binding protein [Marinobacter iranensis]
MVNRIAIPLKWAGIMVAAAFSTTALSAPCDPEENSWIPSRYYPPGQTVFHRGDWYESRELHEGKTPGADFEWKKLGSAPDCGAGNEKAVTQSRQGTPEEGPGLPQSQKPATASEDEPAQHCNEPGRWSFGGSYTVGQMAIHEGQTYRAIRPSNGQMPGMSQPPHWQPVEHPCQDRANNGN